jgi:hypothetical protein
MSASGMLLAMSPAMKLTAISSRATGYRKLAAAVLMILGVPLLCATAAYAQTTTSGDVAGVVQDPSQAAVPNATVTLKDTDTGATRSTMTNGQGEYRFTFMKPGPYTISASAAGLQSDINQIQVLVGQAINVTLVAKVQSTASSIEVVGVASLVDVQSPNLGATISTHDIENLPTPGGDITSVVFSTPGVAVSTGNGYGNFSVHGLPGTSNLFTVNGNDYNDAYLNLNNSGASNLLLGANEIQEATIVLNPYSVQYGRQAGAQIDYTTKSGTNAFHGNLLWNWNGDLLNANTFFNNVNGVPRPRAVSNQYGASIGGPIKKNKLFFFADTEGIRYALPTTGYVTIPSPQLQSWILDNVTGAQAPFYQKAFQFWNGAPGAGGGVPVTNGSGGLQDSSGALGCGDFAGTAAPNGGVFGTNVSCATAWGANGSNLNTEWLMTLRGDWNINDKHKIYLRFKEDHGLQPTQTSLINPVFNVQSLQPTYEGQINHTWTISPTMVNNIVLSFSWYSAFFNSPNLTAAVAAFPVNFFLSDGGSNGAGGFTQMGLGSDNAGFNYFPQGRNIGQGQLTDDFSLVRGRHVMKFGVNYRKDRVTDSSLLSGTDGQYNFSSLTDFATGQLVNGSNYSQAFPSILAAHILYYSLGAYAQDEWSVKSNLKITFGLRLDRNTNPSCSDKCFARLDEPFSSPAFAKGIDIPYNQSIETGLTHAFASTQFGVFQPRVGIVYSPKNTHGAVIRAGFGLFSDLSPAALASEIFTNAPNSFSAPVLSGSVNTAGDPTSASALALAGAQAFRAGFAQGYTFTQLNNALSAIGGFSPPAFFATANNILAPKFLEYSLEIQLPLDTRDVLDITYTGNHGRDLLTVNPAVNAFGFSSLPGAAPDPRFSTVNEMANGGISNYNGLTVAVRRALGYGFHGEIGYTWSHSLDDISSQLGEPYNSTSNNLSQTELNTPFSPKFNYSNSDYDIRHNLTADFLWDLPFKPGSRLLKQVIGGWTLSSRFYLHSGLPFSVYDLNEAATLIGNNVSPVNYNGFLATLLPGTPMSCSRGAVNNACFTTANFAASGSETGFGNVPRNSFRGPGFFDWDATLYKSFAVKEHYRFTIGASAYNLLNHPNFDTPSANISAPGLGLINNTVSLPTSAYGAFQGSATSARLLVLAAKFQF